MKTTLDILWAAIKDIETMEAKTKKQDPVNGLLPLNNKLTKLNVSHQSAKYNNGKRISRPTIDTYDEIISYIKGHSSNSIDRNIINDLQNKNDLLKKNVQNLMYLNQMLVEENRALVEKQKLPK